MGLLGDKHLPLSQLNMDKNIRYGQIIFICSFLLLLVGCHNNAHLRTQKVLKPGEKAYSGSSVLAITDGGTSKHLWDNYDGLLNTGVIGFRGELSMLMGGEDSEAGPYFGAGILDIGEGNGPGLIMGYDYRKYTNPRRGSPKKWGAQIEVNISEVGKVFHLRPSVTSTTKKGKPFYGGLHGLFAVGNLKENTRLTWRTVDSSVVNVGFFGQSYGSKVHVLNEKIDYHLKSLGIGLTAGLEFRTFNKNSIQLQVDISVVKNSFNTDYNIPVKDWDNISSPSWQKIDDEFFRLPIPMDLSRDDQLAPLISGSIGMSFFKPVPILKESFEPLPAPSYNTIQIELNFDLETGETIIKKQFDPETGVLKKTELDD